MKTNSNGHNLNGELTDFVIRAQAGDNYAFTKLYEAYFPVVVRGLQRRAHNIPGMDCEYAAHDILSKAYEKLDELNNPKKFYSWVYKIALNYVRTQFREIGKTRSLEEITDGNLGILPGHEISQDAELDHQERAFHLQNALPKLELKYQVVIDMLLAGNTDKECAEHLGIPVGTAKTWKHRAINNLRYKMRGDYPELRGA